MPTPASSDSQLIKGIVDGYQLHAGGAKFWAPYFINNPKFSPDPDHFRPGPYKGKGTPAQLQAWVNRFSQANPGQRTPQQWRQTLIDHGVGIECSGFAYYILDSFLAAKGLGRLWQYLFISKGSLLEAYDEGRAPKGVTRQQIETGPDLITLKDFSKRWRKDPRRNTNVRRLVSAAATNPVRSVGAARPGDMLEMSGPAGDHIGLIIQNNGQQMMYVDSVGYELKGVTHYPIKVINPASHIEDQDWGADGAWYHQRYHFHGLRRLKVLDQ